MSPIYTRTGDDGTTGLLGKGRLPKFHPRMEAIGALDEASAAIGLARALSQIAQTQSILAETQRNLYALMAETAATPENASNFQSLDLDRVQWLEAQTDAITARIPMPQGFILPGDTPAGAALSLARTVVRRAERRVAELIDAGEITSTVMLPYLNRLSSLCFVLELEANHAAGKETSPAKKSISEPKT
jgi:cob(I)alamin adenosyltransferase